MEKKFGHEQQKFFEGKKLGYFGQAPTSNRSAFSVVSIPKPATRKEIGGVIYKRAANAYNVHSPGVKLTARRENIQTPNKIMGDRSPKANQKKSTQKQSKTAGANQQKQNVSAAKQAAKVAPKKK